jgi:hypothetical protein
MLGNKITRTNVRYFLVLALLVSPVSMSQAQSQLARDGYSWVKMDKLMKVGYVMGFADAAAWAQANVEGQLAVLKSLSPKDRKVLAETKTVWDYGNIYYTQLVDGMNDFYSENLNKAIKWDRALSYERDCIHGAPRDFLEKELSFERRLATQN